MKPKNHEKMFRNVQARSIARGLNLFFTACGHTGFKCNTLFENFPSTRGRALVGVCGAHVIIVVRTDSPVVGDNNIGHE